MLARVGIGTKWYSNSASCRRRPDNPIAIRMVSRAPENDHPDALAAARPFDGTRIEVFYERIRRAVDSGLVPRLLAHVLVHEITHIIEGTDSHSDFGIMKAHWDTEDYHQMMLAPLRFTDEDLQLIRNGLRSRIDHTREAPAPQIEARLTIKLRAYNQAHVSNRSLKQAESEVTSILKRIGIMAEWVTDDVPQFRIVIGDAVGNLTGSADDVFGFTPRQTNGLHSDRAYIFYGRLQKLIREEEPWRYPPIEPGPVLGYLIAHELGHLLLPAPSHSSIGIMRERWEDQDFKRMVEGTMSFTSEQAVLIRNQVSRLSQRW
jgi:hypothetical protein